MIFFMKVAWRNIFRNKRRTIIASIAIGIGLASLIFTDAMMIGMEDNIVKTITSTILGEAQIHQKDYRELQKTELFINDSEKILEKLKKDKRIKNFTPRVMNFAMINSAVNNNPIFLYGIDPKTESEISQIDDYLVEGSYFKENEKSLVIGKELAENLEVELGERLILTVTSLKDNELQQEMLKVTGIFDMPSDEIEKGMVFIHIKKAQNLLQIDNNINEIALNFVDSKFSKLKENFFTEEYAGNGNEAATWPTIMPQMKIIFKMKTINIAVISIIIFGIVIFGIFNTLFMSIYERMFEFAVLRAVGTRVSSLRKLIILESFFLAVFASLIGSIMGFALTFWYSIKGIDYTGIEFNGVTFAEFLYPVLKIEQFLFYPILIVGFVVLVSIYPAFHAGKLNVATSMRKSL